MRVTRWCGPPRDVLNLSYNFLASPYREVPKLVPSQLDVNHLLRAGMDTGASFTNIGPRQSEQYPNPACTSEQYPRLRSNGVLDQALSHRSRCRRDNRSL